MCVCLIEKRRQGMECDYIELRGLWPSLHYRVRGQCLIS